MDLPNWVSDPRNSEYERDRLRMTYLLKLAAIRHNPRASLTVLADAMGVTRQVFYTAMHEGKTTPAVAASLENLIGRDVLRREDLCPLDQE